MLIKSAQYSLEIKFYTRNQSLPVVPVTADQVDHLTWLAQLSVFCIASS